MVPPTPRSARNFALTVWLLVAGGWETFVWGNIRAGSVSVAGTPRSFRFLVRAGLGLTIALLFSLLFSDTWRRLSPLVPMLFYSDSLSGLYAPTILVPITIGLLTLAWAYLVSGALHAPWWGKAAVLALLAIFDMGLTLQLITSLPEDLGLLAINFSAAAWPIVAILAHVVGWVALLALFALRWRRPARPGFEFPAVLAIMTLMFFSSHYGTLASSQVFQATTAATALQLTSTLETIGIFLIPFLLISGSEVAAFGMTLTSELTGRLGRPRAAEPKWLRRLWFCALLVFILWRIATLWIGPLISRSFVAPGGGALVAVVVGVLLYLLLRRRPAVGNLPGWVVPAAAILLYVMLLVVELVGFAASIVAAVLISSGLSPDRILVTANGLFAFISRDNEVLVAGLALAIGLLLWLRASIRRQPLPAAALFAWMFAAWLLFWVFTRRGQLLGRLSFQYRDIEALMALVLLISLLLAGLARRLSRQTLLHLTAAAILLWLLESQSWLSDPLSPVFGLLGAQAFFLSVSIFLNVMQAGDHFALNEEAEGFPRMSRAQLYFGYALLTVTTINWLAASHNAPAVAQQGQIATNGFIAIGLPLAFWTLLTANSELVGADPSPARDDNTASLIATV
jgi:hypothetical protein